MRVDVITIFPGLFPGPLGDGIIARASEAGLLDPARARPARLRRGAAPPGRRRAVRRGRGHGAQAGAAVRCGGVGARPARRSRYRARPGVLAVSAGRNTEPAQSRENGPMGAIHAALRPLRGCRRKSPRTPGRQRAFNRRLCPYRRRNRGHGGRRSGYTTARRRLGDAEAADRDSFSGGLLDYPQYTRPAEFRGYTAPEVLRSGNHQAIAAWRHQQSLLATARKRPDLLADEALSENDKEFLKDETRE